MPTANPAWEETITKIAKARMTAHRIIVNVRLRPNLSETMPQITRPAQLLKEYRLT